MKKVDKKKVDKISQMTEKMCCSIQDIGHDTVINDNQMDSHHGNIQSLTKAFKRDV